MTIRPIRKDLGDLRDVMVSATEPTVRNDGGALETNDVWLDLGSDPQVWKVYDGAAFQTVGEAAAILSDVDPVGLGQVGPGTASKASRDDHVHPLGPWDEFVMRSPDGTLWDMTVDNTGAWVSTSFDALLAENGDLLTAEDGDILALE